MCGIAFTINYNKKGINPEFYKILWEELSRRGTDASGYYFERKSGNGLTRKLIKANIDSKTLWKYLNEHEKGKPYRLNGTERLVIFHCRAKTKGTEENNYNNMPIESKNYILSHNGIIRNDHENKEYKYIAEVDSEEILANVETYGMVDGLAKTLGSMSVIIKPKRKDHIIIYKNNNPLVLFYSSEEKILIGISDEDYIPEQLMDIEATKNIFNPLITLYRTVPKLIYKISTIKQKIEILGDLDQYKVEEKIESTEKKTDIVVTGEKVSAPLENQNYMLGECND